jgi:hypothetical protein
MPNEENPEETLETLPEETNLELEPEAKAEGEDGDPLDKIEDAEGLRAEAKKFRAIAQRKDKKPEVKPVVKEDKGDYLKKSDFELGNQKVAIKMATGKAELNPQKFGVETPEQLGKIQQDILENWDEIIKNYTPRRGKDTAEDILEDIKDAYVLFSVRRPNKEDKPDISELSKTKVIPGQVSPKGKETPVKDPPGFKLPSQPKDWYPKKS